METHTSLGGTTVAPMRLPVSKVGASPASSLAFSHGVFAMPCHAAVVKLYMEDGVRSSLHSCDVRNIDGLVYQLFDTGTCGPRKDILHQSFGSENASAHHQLEDQPTL